MENAAATLFQTDRSQTKTSKIKVYRPKGLDRALFKLKTRNVVPIPEPSKFLIESLLSSTADIALSRKRT